jgi:hypothetical protein
MRAECWVFGGVASLALLAPSVALAQLSQPDGTPIPQGNGLQGLFDSRGEGIDALAVASAVPETFQPSCSLTFEVLQRNAGYQNAFGWYNVTGSAARPERSARVPSLLRSAIGHHHALPYIKNDPAYLGGEVGFYEGVVTGGCGPGTGPADYAYVFYSETEYNPDSGQANPYYHLLTYNSTVVPNAFYFGWEDLISGGDNDFDDLTTFVTGITCSGGGGECQTGAPGVCGLGTLQCQNGELACLPLVEPRTRCATASTTTAAARSTTATCATRARSATTGTASPAAAAASSNAPPTSCATTRRACASSRPVWGSTALTAANAWAASASSLALASCARSGRSAWPATASIRATRSRATTTRCATAGRASTPATAPAAPSGRRA